MPEKYSEFSTLCPWCRKGYTKVAKTADTRILTICSVCGNCYEINCETMQATKRKKAYSFKMTG